MSKVTISVVEHDGEYFASRTFPGSSSFILPGVIFSITEEVGNGGEVDALEERAKQEARKRGIAHVQNLDD